MWIDNATYAASRNKRDIDHNQNTSRLCLVAISQLRLMFSACVLLLASLNNRDSLQANLGLIDFKIAITMLETVDLSRR